MSNRNNTDKERRIQELIDELYDYDYGQNAARELDKLGWEPRNDKEKARYLITKKQWDELVKLGDVGIKQLIQDLKDNEPEEYGWYDTEYGTIWDMEEYSHALDVSQTLIKIGE
ncbi:MAG: hypothetical protein Q6362_002605, partial [Candidatus Wukongarchaeota archaeon]|nr:hypothetical protein [Candidatus Wukongarchaeota archaeon]